MGEDSKLHVGKLPPDIRDDEIKMVFSTYGRVVDIFIMESERHKPKAAFVTYDTHEAAKIAVQVLDGVYKFREDGSQPDPIKVGLAKNKGSKGGGKGGGYDRDYDRGFRGNERERGHDRDYDRDYDRNYDRDRRAPQSRGHSRSRGYDRHAGGYDRDYDRGNDRDRGFGRGGDRGDQDYDRGYDRGQERGGRGPDRGVDRGYERDGDRGGYSNNRQERDSDRGGRGSKPQSIDPKKIYAENLPADITRDALETVFSTYGRVEDIHIMTGRAKSGQSAAFILYTRSSDARSAIAAMEQGYEIRPGEGNISVKIAHDRAGKGGDRGGGRQSRPY